MRVILKLKLDFRMLACNNMRAILILIVCDAQRHTIA